MSKSLVESSYVTKLPFTQYLLPDGKTKEVEFPIPEDWDKETKKIATELCNNDKVYFECEILTNGRVALYAQHKDIVEQYEVDWCIECCDNGPEVPFTLHRLMHHAYESLQELELGEHNVS